MIAVDDLYVNRLGRELRPTEAQIIAHLVEVVNTKKSNGSGVVLRAVTLEYELD
jgi:hypothetical protein